MTIVEQVTVWANAGKPGWWKYTIQKALASGSLSQEDFRHVLLVAQMEYGLLPKQDNYNSLIADIIPTGFGEEQKPSFLQTIKNVENVGALAAESTLKFKSSGLTAVYGNNGAGKSSYAKILKSACLSRGEQPVITANMHAENKGESTAILEVLSGGQTHDFRWVKGQDSIEELKCIRVFDSSSSLHYLTKSGVIEYQPPALNILDELKSAVEFVKASTNRDRASLTIPYSLPVRAGGSEAALFTPNIRTTAEIIEKLSATQGDLDLLPSLQKDLATLQSSTPEEIKKKYQNQIHAIAPLLIYLRGLETYLGDAKIASYGRLYDDLQTKRSVSANLANESFSNLGMSNLGSIEWQKMWEAMRNFIALPPSASFPPRTGDNCPACLQPIKGEAEVRLAAFETYIKSDLQSQAENAQRAYGTETHPLARLTFSLAPYEGALELLSAVRPTVKDELGQIVAAYQERLNAIRNCQFGGEINSIDKNVVTKLEELLSSLQQTILATQDNSQLSARINDVLSRINDINSKIIISQCREPILNEITRLKKVQALNNLEASASTSSITTLNSKISKSESTGQISNYFEEELNAMGFSGLSVQASIRGAKASQVMSIKMPQGNLIDIASEGEQKCISLAAFLAELRADGRNSCIVFDDPVTSLDHDWRLKFAKRICEESKKRQVIVLTHDIVFLWMLQHESPDGNIIALSRTKYKTGIPLERPPWDAESTKDRVGRIKSTLQSIKALEAQSQEEFSEASKKLYGKMRETWEKLIEEWLLKGVVQRFGREIHPSSIRYLTDIENKDIQTITDAYNRCSTDFDGHSNAAEIGVHLISFEEIEADVRVLESYFKELKKRR